MTNQYDRLLRGFIYPWSDFFIIAFVKNATGEDKASTKDNKEIEKSEQSNDDVHKSRKRRASDNEANSTDRSVTYNTDVKAAKVIIPDEGTK